MTMEINKILRSKPTFTETEQFLSYDAKTRTIEHVISSNRKNCYGFRLSTSGYEDEYFGKAGIVLLNHMDGDAWAEQPTDPKELVAGLSKRRFMDNGKLCSSTTFPETQLGNDLNYFYGAGFMKSWSAGWDFPDDTEDINSLIADMDGVPTILRWVMPEFSAVYKPANIDATKLNNMLSYAKSPFLKRQLSKDYLIENAETELSELREAIKQLKEGAEFCTPKQLQDLKNELKSLVGENKKQLNDKIFGVMLNINQLPSNLHDKVLSEIPSLVESVIRKYIGKVD